MLKCTEGLEQIKQMRKARSHRGHGRLLGIGVLTPRTMGMAGNGDLREEKRQILPVEPGKTQQLDGIDAPLA